MVNLSRQKIYVLDGAMGTEIQLRNLVPNCFKHQENICEGFNDILNLNRPDIIYEIHSDYLQAGADIIETNTFNANYVSALDYNLPRDVIDKINFQGAKIAKSAAEKYGGIVAGVLGPTSKTLSMSPDVSDPSCREIKYQELLDSYREAAKNLIAGGADLIMIETVFDTLNAKAAIEAVRSLDQHDFPIMISGTIVDKSGRTLSGQTIDAFWHSVKHAKPVSIGINCALGAKEMEPYVKRLSHISNCLVSAHPNAGLPNELGEYDQSPCEMSEVIRSWARQSIVNIVGGCCGTTPDHIKKMSEAVRLIAPRCCNKIPDKSLVLSGLEEFNFKDKNFVNIGERTNVTGSSRFKKCIFEKRYDDAIHIARHQIKNGAQIIDINLDDGLLDSKEEMVNFLKIIACEPDIASVPIMIDSSDWGILKEAMRWIPGRGIVNSISLKDGEKVFVNRAHKIVKSGHAFVVMAFDEQGQADTFERKKEICGRAYNILIESGIDPKNIIFDPNIFAIATGIKEHDNYGVDFIDAVRWIKNNLPGCRTSGGVSNLSFSFRGNSRIREMMHSVFLYHSIKAGLDMAIVNAGQLVVYESIDPSHRKIIEDTILNKSSEAASLLLDLAKETSGKTRSEISTDEWRSFSNDKRIEYALVNGVDRYIVEDVSEEYGITKDALGVVEGPLMSGMDVVGELFGSGKMFLPQVVKSARVMKKAVEWLEPHMKSKGRKTSKGKILMATVKGDVHDIGKNIVSVVLQCNGYEIIDLGVMVPMEKILSEADNHKVDAIGLSGLITPSLEEMVKIAKEMKRLNLDIPLLIGGATTSKVHTAIKISNEYNKAAYISNASVAVSAVGDILNKQDETYKAINESYETIRKNRKTKQVEIVSLEAANQNHHKLSSPPVSPINGCIHTDSCVSIREVVPYIDWRPFAMLWGMKPKDLKETLQGRELVADALEMIKQLEDYVSVFYSFSIDKCVKIGNDVTVHRGNSEETFNFLRQSMKKTGGVNLCLSDFLHPEDWLGTFAVCVKSIDKIADRYKIEGDDYKNIMVQGLGDRIVEATAEWLHEKVRKDFWGYAPSENYSSEELASEKYVGIRPAPGYPACPDHTQKIKILRWLDVLDHIELTEGLTMLPKAAICGWYFANSEARYFGVGNQPREYLEDLENRNYVFKKYKNHLE